MGEVCPDVAFAQQALTCEIGRMDQALQVNEQISALRIVDAAANRTGEGLRVVEDFLRFALEDRHLTEICKRLRHDLTALLAQISTQDRVTARETLRDLGTEISTPTEQQRDDLRGVVSASFKRAEQALRSLEEYSKLVSPGVAAGFEKLRYALYTLERATEITASSLDRLAKAQLYVLLDGRKTAEEFATIVQSLIAGGVHIIQLRDKQLDDRTLLSRARHLRELTNGTSTLFIMNDRPDLARLSQADGVHVGQEELAVKDCRAILGVEPLVGVSTHSLEQARQAILDGANYIGVGPTFPSATKNFKQFTGLDFLRQVAREIRLPTFAIGGITAENLNEVISTGVRRFAVSNALVNAPDIEIATQILLRKLKT